MCRGHYVSSNVPGGDISAPKFSLCLPVPYVKERAFSAGLTAQLELNATAPCDWFHPLAEPRPMSRYEIDF